MLDRRVPKHVNFQLPSRSIPGRRVTLSVPMKRKSCRHILNAIFFVGALCLILYSNRSNSNHDPFAWTTVRYKSASKSLPESLGACPGLKSTTKPALIVARISTEDKSWLDHLSDNYHVCPYTADTPHDSTSKSLQVPANRGHEAMAYLTFIIDNYDTLPEAGAVFAHGSRFAWHNDHPNYDNLALLRALNVSSALTPYGYHNLKCDWAASTCPPETEPQGSLHMSARKLLEPFNANVVSDAALPGALEAIFGYSREGVRTSLGRSNAVKSQCCAQFAVARENIVQHSREEYIALRQWLLDGSLDNTVTNQRLPQSRNRDAAHPDDRVAGRVLSYIWHILFTRHGKEGVELEKLNQMACPSAGECYCKLYGRCDLEGCGGGRCRGQYALPKGFRLPEGWAEKYG